MLDAFIQSLDYLFRADTMLLILLGNIIGLIFGALPGLGGVIALAILLPFTFGMNPMVAMFFLAAIMGSIAFGGSISAILLNTPGTAPNAATCLDGYPMARRGEARKALGISAAACGIGATFGLVVLALLIPIVRRIVMLFGPPEFFMLVLFGLITVAFAAKGNLIKGLFAGGVGILLSLIGYNPVFGGLRFNLGSEYLWDGIAMIPFLIGIFAISELINYSIKGGKIAGEEPVSGGSAWDGVKEVMRHKAVLLQSSTIGVVIGIIPGVGGAVANFIAYIAAMHTSKNPESFGKGNPAGIVASESSNDAKDGGALLPTVGFGIPGSAEMAVLLGGFILHGLEVGPMLIKERLDIVFALILGLFISNILASSFGLLMSRHLAKLTHVNIYYIVPIVAVLCFVGAYVLRENIYDVILALVAGIFGFFMMKFGFPNICLVIGFILGELAEKAFHQSLMMSYGSYSVFFTRGITLTILGLIVLVLIMPFITGSAKRRHNEPTE